MTDDTVLEDHSEDPCLVQMRLIGDGGELPYLYLLFRQLCRRNFGRNISPANFVIKRRPCSIAHLSESDEFTLPSSISVYIQERKRVRSRRRRSSPLIELRAAFLVEWLRDGFSENFRLFGNLIRISARLCLHSTRFVIVLKFDIYLPTLRVQKFVQKY